MTATSNARAASSLDQPRTSPVSTRALLIAGAAAGRGLHRAQRTDGPSPRRPGGSAECAPHLAS